MPWTIPNLLLHEKPVTLGMMRNVGRGRVFVYCSNLDFNAEIDVGRLPDSVMCFGME
jgi:hypothetical protein